ncbi:MAG: geranylgeranylglyceryl/heptaprenylglyceryl phosphate synthase [Alphaproteobacteria bacterium]|nr:geranylgeranylglyceryl/heptaprenylglyceryl phosphate synthase [Alphaproteobacteria bacterium]
MESNSIFTSWKNLKLQKNTALAVLIDPDKLTPTNYKNFILYAKKGFINYFFIGGSLVLNNKMVQVIDNLKSNSKVPVVLFPGNPSQFCKNADALLFLSLISGRNPDLLIGQHVLNAVQIKKTKIEVIPTGYMLIDGGKPTSVSYISNTLPIPANKTDIAVSTAVAGELLGLKTIFMDAGSGAINPIPNEMIQAVSKHTTCPLIVGGGVKDVKKMTSCFDSGANIVVIGNAFESNPNFIKELYKNSVKEL